MKREIKFRCWDGEKMIHCDFNSRITMVLSDLYDQGKVMLCTNRKDSNGTEIYEGDIVEAENLNEFGSITKELGEVKWIDDLSGLVGVRIKGDEMLLSTIPTRCWIKGNIYENPDLLKK